MTNWLLTYSVRTRKVILVLIAAIILLGIYQLAIRATLTNYISLAKHKKAGEASTTELKKLDKLRRELAALNQQIGKNKNANITNSTLLLVSENQIADLSCKVYAVPKTLEDKGEQFTYGISELVLEGDYKSLVQALSKIETSAIGGHLVSAKYAVSENWENKKKNLLLHLVFKQIRNEE
jgi:cell division protein FtsB